VSCHGFCPGCGMPGNPDGDRYEEDILVHEFAHGVQHISAETMHFDFMQRLEDTYQVRVVPIYQNLQTVTCLINRESFCKNRPYPFQRGSFRFSINQMV
jgi:hypothetical protein